MRSSVDFNPRKTSRSCPYRYSLSFILSNFQLHLDYLMLKQLPRIWKKNTDCRYENFVRPV